MNTTASYLPIVLQAIVALGFVGLVLTLTHLLGPSSKTKNKIENFECGIEQQGNARIPVSVKYFMTAILFVLFDVEVIFFYPYAVNFKDNFGDPNNSAAAWQSFLAVGAFVGVFLMGFFYVLKKGALEWER
jgi:NADH-quinone oxidoreductase subunit A